MFSLPTTSGLRQLTITIALVLAYVVAPSRATAGCGDYDMPNHPSVLEKLKAKHDSKPTTPRCHGPNCSNVPPISAPIPKTPVQVPTGNDDLTVLLTCPKELSQGSSSFAADQVDQIPDTIQTVIYHPPR